MKRLEAHTERAAAMAEQNTAESTPRCTLPCCANSPDPSARPQFTLYPSWSMATPPNVGNAPLSKSSADLWRLMPRYQYALQYRQPMIDSWIPQGFNPYTARTSDYATGAYMELLAPRIMSYNRGMYGQGRYCGLPMTVARSPELVAYPAALDADAYPSPNRKLFNEDPYVRASPSSANQVCEQPMIHRVRYRQSRPTSVNIMPLTTVRHLEMARAYGSYTEAYDDVIIDDDIRDKQHHAGTDEVSDGESEGRVGTQSMYNPLHRLKSCASEPIFITESDEERDRRPHESSLIEHDSFSRDPQTAITDDFTPAFSDVATEPIKQPTSPSLSSWNDDARMLTSTDPTPSDTKTSIPRHDIPPKHRFSGEPQDQIDAPPGSANDTVAPRESTNLISRLDPILTFLLPISQEEWTQHYSALADTTNSPFSFIKSDTSAGPSLDEIEPSLMTDLSTMPLPGRYQLPDYRVEEAVTSTSTKPKRGRNFYTKDEEAMLVEWYAGRSNYIRPGDIQELATRTTLTLAQLRAWIANQRRRERRKRKRDEQGRNRSRSVTQHTENDK